LKKRVKELEGESKGHTGLLDPLKRENNRLVKQNNELHLELMRVKEDTDGRDGNWRLTLKTLESENTDLKFLTTKLRADLRRAE
jgi:centrosomal protein CEP135